MSSEPTTPQQDERTDVEASRTVPRARVQFPRLELPTVPAFARPTTPSDELPAQRPLVDAPAATWQSPFPTPEATNAYAFQTASQVTAPAPRHGVPRSAHATYCALPVAAPAAPAAHAAPAAPVAPIATTAHASVPAFVRASVPHIALEGDDPAVDAPTDVSNVALAILFVTAAVLVWASRMAFSPAVLATSALLLAELGIALSLTGAKRPTSAVLAAGAAGVLALLALKGAVAGFGEMAFVASLFVLVAALPTLLLLGATEYVLRRRSSTSAANAALRAGTPVRFGAALALLVSGFLAKDSFSAKPDTFAAFAIIALVAFGVVQVLRGIGRAARA